MPAGSSGSTPSLAATRACARGRFTSRASIAPSNFRALWKAGPGRVSGPRRRFCVITVNAREIWREGEYIDPGSEYGRVYTDIAGVRGRAKGGRNRGEKTYAGEAGISSAARAHY